MKQRIAGFLSLLLFVILYSGCNQDKTSPINKDTLTSNQTKIENQDDSTKSISTFLAGRIKGFSLKPMSIPGDSPTAGVDPIEITLYEGDKTTITFFKYPTSYNTRKISVRLDGGYQTGREKTISNSADTLVLDTAGTYKINIWQNVNTTFGLVNFVNIPVPATPHPKVWGYYNYHNGSIRKPTDGVIIIVMDEEIMKGLENE